MKTTIILLLIAVIAAIFTNPDVKEHKEQINVEFKEKNAVAGAFGAGKLAAEFVEYEDYKVCSLTKYEDKPVSIGIFTKVFVLKDLSLQGL